MIVNFAIDEHNALEDLDLTHARLEKEGFDAVDQAGCLIDKYEMSNSIGICLLHWHCALSGTERIVESFAKDSITFSRTPGGDKNLTPYLLKVATNSPTDWMPMEFLAPESVPEDVDVRLTDSAVQPLLDDLAKLFVASGLQETLGVFLLHRIQYLRPLPTEILLERPVTTRDAGSYVVSSVPEQSIDKKTLKVTVFRFDATSGTPQRDSIQWCCDVMD